MPDGFLLKSVVFKLISKEISRAEHEYMNIHPPINALATALHVVVLNPNVSSDILPVNCRYFYVTASKGGYAGYHFRVFLHETNIVYLHFSVVSFTTLITRIITRSTITSMVCSTLTTSSSAIIWRTTIRPSRWSRQYVWISQYFIFSCPTNKFITLTVQLRLEEMSCEFSTAQT